MDYKKIFSSKTLANLNKKSSENLKQMLGNKSLTQTMLSSQQLLNDIEKAEKPYRQQLEKLAVSMVKELYPIIEEEGIVLDAKLVGIADVNKSLDEIKVNDPNKPIIGKLYDIFAENSIDEYNAEFLGIIDKGPNTGQYMFRSTDENGYGKGGFRIDPEDKGIEIKLSKNQTLDESISPEGRRRIINSITQGAALKGAFAFYLFKEHLDELDPSLVDKYNQIMKNSFGIYDDPNVIALLLSLLSQNQKMAGGSSKVIIK